MVAPGVPQIMEDFDNTNLKLAALVLSKYFLVVGLPPKQVHRFMSNPKLKPIVCIWSSHLRTCFGNLWSKHCIQCL